MNPDTFRDLISEVTSRIEGSPFDARLQGELNREFPAEGPLYRRIADACTQGIAEGWMCQRQMAGIRYGRVIPACAQLGGFSVDVVEMCAIVGPHHGHPHGEIDLILPQTSGARFDGHASGWLVYGPGSAHSPTVTGGTARILYLLPQGSIEFTKI